MTDYADELTEDPVLRWSICDWMSYKRVVLVYATDLLW